MSLYKLNIVNCSRCWTLSISWLLLHSKVKCCRTPFYNGPISNTLHILINIWCSHFNLGLFKVIWENGRCLALDRSPYLRQKNDKRRCEIIPRYRVKRQLELYYLIIRGCNEGYHSSGGLNTTNQTSASFTNGGQCTGFKPTLWMGAPVSN